MTLVSRRGGHGGRGSSRLAPVRLSTYWKEKVRDAPAASVGVLTTRKKVSSVSRVVPLAAVTSHS